MLAHSLYNIIIMYNTYSTFTAQLLPQQCTTTQSSTLTLVHVALLHSQCYLHVYQVWHARYAVETAHGTPDLINRRG